VWYSHGEDEHVPGTTNLLLLSVFRLPGFPFQRRAGRIGGQQRAAASYRMRPRAASSFQSQACARLSRLAHEDIINKRINMRDWLLEQVSN